MEKSPNDPARQGASASTKSEDENTTDKRVEGEANQSALSAACLQKSGQKRPHAASFDTSQRFYSPMLYQSATAQAPTSPESYGMNARNSMPDVMPSNQANYWQQPAHHLQRQYFTPNTHAQQGTPMYLSSSQQAAMQSTSHPYMMSTSSQDAQYAAYPRQIGPTLMPNPNTIVQQPTVGTMPPVAAAQDLRRTNSQPSAAGYRRDSSSGIRYHGVMPSGQTDVTSQAQNYTGAVHSHAGTQSSLAGHYGMQQHYPAQQYGFNYAAPAFQPLSSGYPGATVGAVIPQDTVEIKKRGNEWTAEETIALLLFTQLMLDCDLKTISQALFSYISRAPGKSSGRAAEKKLKRMKIFKNWKGANKHEVQQNINAVLQHYGVLHRKVSPQLEHVAMSFKDAETTGTLNQLIEFYEGTEGRRELFCQDQPLLWRPHPPG